VLANISKTIHFNYLRLSTCTAAQIKTLSDETKLPKLQKYVQNGQH
jgi:hypothetical protein